MTPVFSTLNPVDEKLDQLRRMALDLMNLHGLHTWRFVWHRSVRRYGQCRHGSREIGISRAQAISNPVDNTRDVILHEIAHALVGHAAGHGPVWKAKCAEIGLVVTDRFARVAEPPAGAWIGTCPNGHTTTRYRLTKRARGSACTICCRTHNGGLFTSAYMFTWARNS